MAQFIWEVVVIGKGTACGMLCWAIFGKRMLLDQPSEIDQSNHQLIVMFGVNNHPSRLRTCQSMIVL